jgi:hypothetical protein
MPADAVYNMMMRNANIIFPRVDEEYREEIEGLASQFSPNAADVCGDGLLSRDEIIAYNLITDVIRVFGCSAVAVFGERSLTGRTIAARNLDFFDGGIASKLHAVLTIHNGSKSICSIGFLGHLGALSMFNKNGVFGALLDINGIYLNLADPNGKRSYVMDLRHALENSNSLRKAADYMKDENKKYMCNHLIFFADKKTSMVLENIFSPGGPDITRGLRTWYSELNDGISWGIPNAIGTVNSFVLKGNYDDHTTLPMNANRWESMRRELLHKGQKVSLRELQEVISYSHYNGPGNPNEGDLYFNDNNYLGMGNLQSMIFVPETKKLKVSFRPRNSILLDKPIYEDIPVFLRD